MENLRDLLKQLSDILHWLGKYQEANIVSLLMVMLQCLKIDSYTQFKTYVEELEKKHVEETSEKQLQYRTINQGSIPLNHHVKVNGAYLGISTCYSGLEGVIIDGQRWNRFAADTGMSVEVAELRKGEKG